MRVQKPESAQHSVHPTGGSLRVFRQFAWLEVDSGKMALSRPAHQRVTPSRWAHERKGWSFYFFVVICESRCQTDTFCNYLKVRRGYHRRNSISRGESIMSFTVLFAI